jgi:glycosyltransferase involved in cell wall biosynthesis
VICTYNRAGLLTNALQTLCQQTLKTTHYEVIVVDNNSQDNTRDITEDFSRLYPNIRYCLETRQGLSHARNRGWREAKGAYVAYIDDECKVPVQWLTIAKQIIERLAPAVFGGPFYGFHIGPKPSWWKESYGSFEPSETARELTQSEYLRGGNLFIRQRMLQTVGGFDYRYGMSGQKLGYGEETELQRRIRATMPTELIYYDPKLYVYHLVRLEKMRLGWILYSHFASGRNAYHVFQDTTARAAGSPRLKLPVLAVLTFFRFFADFLAGTLRRDRKRYPHLQNYWVERTFEHVQTLGWVYEHYIHC